MMRRSLALTLIVALSACGGGGTALVPHGAPGQGTNPAQKQKNASVALAVKVPTAATLSALHRVLPKRVSENTQGIGVVVYYHSDTLHQNPVGSAGFDVTGSGSPNPCSAAVNGFRTCTLDFPAPVSPASDSDDIVVSTYAVTPVGGQIPAGSQALDQGTITVAVVAGKSISPSVALVGIPASLSVAIDNPRSATQISPVIYGQVPYNVEVLPFDASGAQIIGSDPYANAVTLRLSPGTATFSVNGTAGAPLEHPSDVVTLLDTSSGTSQIFQTFTASTVNQLGNTVSASTSYTAYPRGVNLNFGYGIVSSPSYLTTGSDGNIYVLQEAASGQGLVQFVTSNANHSLISTTGTPQCATGANSAKSDAVYMVWYNATSAVLSEVPVGTTTLVNSNSIAGITSGPCGIATAADGNAYAVLNNGVIAQFATGTSFATTHLFRDVTYGPDGNLWATWTASSAPTAGISKISVSGWPTPTVTDYVSNFNAGSVPDRIATGADGNLYFTDSGSTQALGRITVSGAVTETTATNGSHFTDITSGPDGSIWLADQTNATVVRYDLTSKTFVASNAEGALITPVGIAVGPDGAIWVSDSQSSIIMSFSP